MGVIFSLMFRSLARICFNLQGLRSFEIKTNDQAWNLCECDLKRMSMESSAIKIRNSIFTLGRKKKKKKPLSRNSYLPNSYFILYFALSRKNKSSLPLPQNMKHCFWKTGSNGLKIKQLLPIKSVVQLHPFKKSSCWRNKSTFSASNYKTLKNIVTFD